MRGRRRPGSVRVDGERLLADPADDRAQCEDGSADPELPRGGGEAGAAGHDTVLLAPFRVLLLLVPAAVRAGLGAVFALPGAPAGGGDAAGFGLGAAPGQQRGPECGELGGVGGAGVGRDGGVGPPRLPGLRDLKAQLEGEGPVPGVVVATLAGGVLDPAGVTEGARGLV